MMCISYSIAVLFWQGAAKQAMRYGPVCLLMAMHMTCQALHAHSICLCEFAIGRLYSKRETVCHGP